MFPHDVVRLRSVVSMIDEVVDYAFETTGITVGFAIFAARQTDYDITTLVALGLTSTISSVLKFR